MSIIQQIRDKAAWLVFGLIGVSLIGFLLMDSSVGNSRLAASSGSVGSVNGEELDYTSFEKQISEREDQYKSQGYPVNDMMQQNIREEVWKQFKEDKNKAIDHYITALKLGGTRTLPELYKAAGLKFSFAPDYISELMLFVQNEMEKITHHS